MPTQVTVFVIAIALGATVAAPAGAAERDFRIAFNSDGEVTKIGKITRIHRRHYSGSALRKRLGKPTSRRRVANEACVYYWRKWSLYATLSNFGERKACDRHNLQLVEAKGKGSSRWHTAEGLYIGDAESHVTEVYPSATEKEVYQQSVWVIAEMETNIGPDDITPTVWARTRNAKVVKLSAWIGGAGD